MKQTGGDALARQLALEGVTDVFGVPGVQLDWAVDGLRKMQDRIRYLVARHEQAASYMADGYARSKNGIGVCMVVPGPGLLNAMAGPCHRLCLQLTRPLHQRRHSFVGRGERARTAP